MRPIALLAGSALCLALAVPAWADRDKDKEHGHGHGHRVEAVVVVPGTVIVSDHDRIAVREWYRAAYVSGGCPPGLARNGGGCLPPGQARKAWALGQPLGSIAFDPLPAALIAELAPLPDKYTYVRVGGDILVVTMGTHIVQQPVLDLAQLSDPEQSQPLVSDADRDAVRNYYRDQYQNGNCPAGLARTDEGCAVAGDPEQAWAIGQPLPPAIAYDPLPSGLLAQLAPAPGGYEYIRIGDRVLLMAVSTRIVTADVIDLGHFRAPVQAVVVPTPVYEGGSCPPGLAKKHNGCLPPGHAK